MRRVNCSKSIAAIVLSMLAMACATESSNSDPADDGQFVGTPPSAEDDPFSVREMPGEAVPAEPKGEISDEDFREPEPGEDDDRDGSEWDEALSHEDSSTDKGQPGRSFRCFSCVRICPVDGGCPAHDREDVICGWGVDSDRKQASRLARAECDGALDLTRKMPVWSRIEGECPAATCQR